VRRLSEQLSVARSIQESVLPRHAPDIEGYDVAGVNYPSEQVGGDYFDFVPIVPGQWGLAVADVSGKGIPAAIIMAGFRASLIAEIRNNYSIRTIFRKVNNVLREMTPRDNFVTAFYGVLDTHPRRRTPRAAGGGRPAGGRHCRRHLRGAADLAGPG
jgi:sigma-B regulation protein RsbU (phosphoserine phosphatase)